MSEPSDSVELSRIQRWFQSIVTNPDGVQAGATSDDAQKLFQLRPDELEKVITRSRTMSAAERLAVYANAYHTRLLECLGEVYPMLKRSLGEEAFDGMAFGFLQKHPSQSPTLNELGRDFARYLEETRPETDVPECGSSLTPEWPDLVIDLAKLEWAIYEVFDGPGVENQLALRADEILSIPAKNLPYARITFAPCIQLLETRFPVNDYYTSLRKVDEPPSIPLPGQTFVALNRRHFIVRRYNLSRIEFELLSALKSGKTIEQSIEEAASASEDMENLEANLQLWFRNWTAEGFFQSITVKEPFTQTFFDK